VGEPQHHLHIIYHVVCCVPMLTHCVGVWIRTEPLLRAGSLMLIVGSVIHGLRRGALLGGQQRLVECRFSSSQRKFVDDPLHTPPPPLPWTAELRYDTV
jgi:hypothetical protein